MISDETSSSNLLAAFGDGTIKLFDRRLDEENAAIGKYAEHTSWIQNVRWHPHKPYMFLSARFVFVLFNLKRYSTAWCCIVWTVRSSFGTCGTSEHLLEHGQCSLRMDFLHLMFTSKPGYLLRMFYTQLSCFRPRLQCFS